MTQPGIEPWCPGSLANSVFDITVCKNTITQKFKYKCIMKIPKCYLIPNSLYYIRYKWFGWVYSISTFVGYLMPNPLYTYILDIYDLLWLGFMASQPL